MTNARNLFGTLISLRTFSLSVLLPLLICLAGQREATAVPPQPPLNLLPWPKSVCLAPGTVRLDEQSRIVIASAKLEPLASILREELRLVIGLDFPIVNEAVRKGDIALLFNEQLKADEDILTVRNGTVIHTREGAYRMTAEDSVTIEGFDYRAVAEGTATLLQAIQRVEDFAVLPAMTIRDWPHADYTGIMLDVARQANSCEEICRCIQICRAYKVRYLQLHLTDDQAWTFPSTGYPKLGTMNGSAHGGPVPPRYDLAELKSLVQFADDRGVTLVPELETPGHSGNACRTLPEVFGAIDPVTNMPVPQGMMNIASPKLYAALDTIIGEMCEVFASSPYFHIGFDEVSGLDGVASTPAAQAFMHDKGLKTSGELLAYFAVQTHAMVKKRGRKTILWEGAANGVAKDIIHMAWDGNAHTATRLVAQGITTVTVPWNLAGVPWNEWSMYHCNGSLLKKVDPVLGAMLPTWEQNGATNIRWLRGTLVKRQERTWGPDTVIEPIAFTRRSAATDTVLDRMLYGFGISQIPPSDEGLFHRKITVPTTLDLPTWPTLGTVHFTTDGSEPTAQSAVFASSIPVADTFIIKARLFDAKGKALQPAWSQPYIFAPLTLQPQGLLPDSTWFAESVRVAIASTMNHGTVRYTLDGSVPQPSSTAFTQPLVLTSTTTIKARWFQAGNVGRGDSASAVYTKLSTAAHAAVNKPLSITTAAKLENPTQAATLLVDGVLSRDGNWGTPEVLRLGESDLETVIDMGARTEVRSVVVRCISCQEAGIYPAQSIEVLISQDGLVFTPAGLTAHVVPAERGADGCFICKLTVVTAATGRYVKVVCKNNGLLPAWHNAPGVLGHLMLDEILVNPVDDA